MMIIQTSYLPLQTLCTLASFAAMAGNIIPAIATTNAVIAGLIVLEGLKILSGKIDQCRTVSGPEVLLLPCPFFKSHISLALTAGQFHCLSRVASVDCECTGNFESQWKEKWKFQGWLNSSELMKISCWIGEKTRLTPLETFHLPDCLAIAGQPHRCAWHSLLFSKHVKEDWGQQMCGKAGLKLLLLTE